jgi:hypothetical protein
MTCSFFIISLEMFYPLASYGSYLKTVSRDFEPSFHHSFSRRRFRAC